MKKFIISIFCLILTISTTSCATKKIDNDEENKLKINVSKEVVETTITMEAPKTISSSVPTESLTEEEEPETLDDDELGIQKRNFLIDNIEKNLDDSINLTSVIVNNEEVRIDGSLKDFIEKTNLKLDEENTLNCNDENLFFKGAVFGLESKGENKYKKYFNGTLVGVECYYYFQLVTNVNEEMPELYTIKGLTSSVKNTKDDFEVIYYGGIKAGMKKDEIITLLGSPKEVNSSDISSTLYYKNTKNTLIIKVKNDTAEEIFLINN